MTKKTYTQWAGSKINRVQKKEYQSSAAFYSVSFHCEVLFENACPHFFRLSWYLGGEDNAALRKLLRRNKVTADDEDCWAEGWECTNINNNNNNKVNADDEDCWAEEWECTNKTCHISWNTISRKAAQMKMVDLKCYKQARLAYIYQALLSKIWKSILIWGISLRWIGPYMRVVG